MNTQQFTGELHKQFAARLAARPFNRFEPENTIWWLVPSTEWPAFKYGKYFVNQAKNSTQFEVGFYLEKGHGSEILQVYGDSKGNRAQILDETWEWQRLIDHDLQQLQEKFEAVAASGFQPKLRLDLHPFSPERGDPDNVEVSASSTITLNFMSRNYKVESSKINPQDDSARSFIEQVAKGTTIENVVAALKNYNQSAWTWIDLLAYVETGVIDSKLLAALNEFEEWIK